MVKATVSTAKITATVKAVAAAGVSVARVEVDHANGRVIVFAENGDQTVSPLDKWLANHETA